MDFEGLLRNRRSIRDFEDREVPLDAIGQIIEESCLAPSSGNGQPWRFIIIQDKEVIKRLSDESKESILSFIKRNPDAPVKQYEESLRDRRFNIFYNAPCLVYILGPKELNSLQVDCALAACYFMFSAANRGLGTCWIGLGSYLQSPELEAFIGIPKECRIVAPIIVGYPKGIPETATRMRPRILKTIS
jgi:nitroreductase